MEASSNIPSTAEQTGPALAVRPLVVLVLRAAAVEDGRAIGGGGRDGAGRDGAAAAVPFAGVATLYEAEVPRTRLRLVACAGGPPNPRGPRAVVVAARGVLAELLAAPADVVHCASIGLTYAATLACVAQALCRPHVPEPAIVTTLDDSALADLSAAATHALRHLSDLVIVESEVARAALLLRRLPTEHIAVMPPAGNLSEAGSDPASNDAALGAIYARAHERRARRATTLMAYEA